MTYRWQRLLYKVTDFVFKVPVGTTFWPNNMHEPLLVGIALPFIRHRPWQLRSTPKLLAIGRQLREVYREGHGSDRSLLRQLLALPKRLDALPEDLVWAMLHFGAKRPVPEANSGRRGRKSVERRDRGRKAVSGGKAG